MELSRAVKLGLALGALVCSVHAGAHGAWIADRAGDKAIVYGHGGSDDAYNPSKVTLVKGFDAANKAINIGQQANKNNVTLDIPEQTAYVGFVLDNGYWTKNKQGKWANKPKNEVEGAESGGHYLKNSITVLSDEANVSAVNGLALQIIPLKNPLTLNAGDHLDVKVLFNGKPLEGAEIVGDYINMSHEVNGKTNKDGVAEIHIRNQGLNVIGASHSVELSNDPKADKEGYQATLSFTLDHVDED